MRRLLLTAAATLTVAATAGRAEAPSQPSFAKDIAPILEENCAVCHLTGTEAGGMSLVADQAAGFIVDKPSQEVPGLMRVKSGDPDASYLVMKLEGTHSQHGGTGAQMPFGGTPLSKETMNLIRQWIAQGAKP